MKLLAWLSMLVTVVAVSFQKDRRQDTLLRVAVESVGNSALKASITNTGSESLKILRTGSILDSRAVERAEVFSGCKYAELGGP